MKKEQKEKIVVYGIVGIIFIIAMWFIFKPSSDYDSVEEAKFKTTLPDAPDKSLPSKREAYNGRSEQKRDGMRRFEELYAAPSDSSSSPTVPAKKEDLFREVKNANSQVRDMYTSMANDEVHGNLVKKNQLLEQRLADMEIRQRENTIRQQQQQADQMITQAQLLTQQTGKEVSLPIESKDDMFSKEVQSTSPLNNSSVSSLTKQGHSEERQHGFNTPVGTGYEMGANTIRACIHEEQTLTDGQRVKLRLLEPLKAGSATLSPGHVIAGVTRLQKDRLEILVNSIEYGGNIIPVAMTVYDTDGSPGIYCPGSEELNAVKEATANVGTSLGSSISFASSAGQQIAMDVTRGILSGGSQYLSKKLRVVKVTLKENYQVLLLPKKK